MSLQAPARNRALEWLQDISFPAVDVESLHVDKNGGVFYIDNLLPDPVEQSSVLSGEPGIESISAVDTFALHSKPGSSNVLFLDFDGHVISSTTAWTNIDLHAVAYDNSATDDDSAFTASELNDIAEIWHRIADDFAPYDIDVTTEEPSIFTSTTGRLLFTKDTDANGNTMPASGGGGVAYVNVFGTGSYVNTYSPALVYYDNLGPNFPPYMAEAGSHEFGHNQGLSHDGTSTVSYYTGHGSGLIKWGPIMGTGYQDNVSQWSKGEYPDANNTQDDLAIMAGKMGYRTDDHGDSLGTATALIVDGTGNIASTNPELDPHNAAPENKGIIEKNTDVDVFYFDAAAGAISLTVLPAWDAFERPSSHRGANLDIEATLYDASGSVVASSDPTDDTRADINTTVTAGRYYLSITGVGNTISPYTDYASLSFYYILGNVVVQNPDTTSPTPNPMTWASVPVAQGKTAIAMTATTATDDSGFVEYNFVCASGGQGCLDSGWQTSTNHTATGLAAGNLYSYQVIARDGSNNQTSASVIASATTDPETVPVAPSAFLATAISTSEISLSWQDNADNEDGFVIERSLDGVSGWSPIASLSPDSSNYVDSVLDQSTTYYYQLKAYNFVGDSSVVSANATTETPPAFIDYVASSETLYSGTVSGSYQATHTDNSSTQNITERQSGGKPANRYDYLQHGWTFNISGGVVVSLFANTWTNADGLEDAFIFEVSTDGTTYTQAFTVTSNDINNVESAVLSSGASGTVYVRVRDTNQSKGKRNQETIYVDHLYLRVENAGSGTVPDAPSGLTATSNSSSQITIDWADNSDNESGFTIERSLDNSNWSVIGMAAANAVSYIDSGLLSETAYYYQVKAFNATGDSGYTNSVSATTDVAPAISLTTNGYKVKGKHAVDLNWSGAISSNVDVYRDGAKIATTGNNGFYNDNIGAKGGATYVYQVCEAGSSDCSQEQTVIF